MKKPQTIVAFSYNYIDLTYKNILSSIEIRADHYGFNFPTVHF